MVYSQKTWWLSNTLTLHKHNHYALSIRKDSTNSQIILISSVVMLPSLLQFCMHAHACHFLLHISVLIIYKLMYTIIDKSFHEMKGINQQQ